MYLRVAPSVSLLCSFVLEAFSFVSLSLVISHMTTNTYGGSHRVANRTLRTYHPVYHHPQGEVCFLFLQPAISTFNAPSDPRIRVRGGTSFLHTSDHQTSRRSTWDNDTVFDWHPKVQYKVEGDTVRYSTTSTTADSSITSSITTQNPHLYTWRKEKKIL